MSTSPQSGLRSVTKAILGALIVMTILGIVLSMVLGQVSEYGVASALGWLAACLLQIAIILVALWWQSLPGLVKRAGKYSFRDPVRKRRRARLLRQPFPDVWHAYLRTNVAVYNILATEDQAKLRDTLRILIAEKRWEGCGGLNITEEIQV